MKRFYTLILALALGAAQTNAVPSWLAQTGNLIKKHPVFTGVATVAGLSLVGFGAWKWYKTVQERHERKFLKDNAQLYNELVSYKNTLQTVQRTTTDNDLTKIKRIENFKSKRYHKFQRSLCEHRRPSLNHPHPWRTSDPIKREEKERKAFFANGYDTLPEIDKDFTNELSTVVDQSIKLGEKDFYTVHFLNNRPDVLSKPKAEERKYKIHIQCKPEHLVEVTREIHKFMGANQVGKYVYHMKTIHHYNKQIVMPLNKDTPLPQAYPTIVLYLTDMPTFPKETNYTIASIVNALVKHFKQAKGTGYLKKIALELTPRFNRPLLKLN